MSDSGPTTRLGKCLLILWVLVFFWSGSAAAADGQRHDEVEPVLNGGGYALEPAEGWSPEQAWQAYRAGAFTAVHKSSINLGIAERPVWLRLVVPGGLPGPVGRMLLQLNWHKFQDAELYKRVRDGWHRIPRVRLLSGVTHAAGVSERPLFVLPPEPGEPQTYLMRLTSYGPLLLAPIVYTPRAFLSKERVRSLVVGLYFGAFGALILYNAFLWLTLRDRSYLWYTIFIALITVFVALNWGVRLDWIPNASERVIFVLVTCVIAALTASGLLFTRKFLLTRERDTVAYRLMTYSLIGAVVAVPVSVFVSARLSIQYDSLMALLAVLAVLVAGVRAVRRRFVPVYFAIPAWLLLLAGTVIHLGLYNGALPYNTFTVHAYPLGSLLHAILLSMALADRIRRLEMERTELAAQRQRYLDMSLTDALTGLPNKRHFMNQLKDSTVRSNQDGLPLTLIMLDIDYFKSWNDTWGHQSGDHVLETVGGVMQENVRDQDIPCRFGGEEFAIILPDAAMKEALMIAERVRKAIARLRLQPASNVTAGITISLGLAELLPREPAQAVLKRADEALYSAKGAGRNRYALATATG